MSRYDQVLATIKPAILGWIEQLTGQVRGTTFPADPTDGLRCFRTHRGTNYYWDADRELWLSTQLHPGAISAARLTLPFTTGAYYGGMPICPLMFLTSLIIRAAPTGTHDSMNYWRMRFRTYGASAPGMVVWETNTNGVPSGMGVIYEQAFAFAFGALEQELYFDTATVGASTNLYVTLGGTYRLIG